MGDVTKLRPKRHDVIVEALQLVLDFGDHFELDQHTRDNIAGAVGKLAPPERWGYVMLNPDQQRLVLKAIRECSAPLTTMAVWNAVISFIAYDRNGEIMANREMLANAAGTRPDETTKALSRLVEIGAIERTSRGRYKINSHVGWSGSLHKRDAVAKEQRPVAASVPPPAGPLLVVMEGGKP